MKNSQALILRRHRRLLIILASILLLLTCPLVAMQFTKEVNWSVLDFVVAAMLLLFAGLSAEWLMQKVKNRKLLYVLLFVILLIFLVFWAELAVGIFGTPFAGS